MVMSPLRAFPFFGAFSMVNAVSVKRKLASLLVNEKNCSNRNKKGWRAYKRYQYRLEQFKVKNPEKFCNLMNRL